MTVYLKIINKASSSELWIRDTIEPGRQGEIEMVFLRGLLEMSVTLTDSELLQVQAALCRDGRVPRVGYNARSLDGIEALLRSALARLEVLAERDTDLA